MSTRCLVVIAALELERLADAEVPGRAVQIAVELVLCGAGHAAPGDRVLLGEVEPQDVALLNTDQVLLRLHLLEAEVGRVEEVLPDESVGVFELGEGAGAPHLQVDLMLQTDDVGEHLPPLDDTVRQRRLRGVRDHHRVGQRVPVGPQLGLVPQCPRVCQ